MSHEDFEITDFETLDNSILRRDFLKPYHQPGANKDKADQNIEFIFGENNNYHQIENEYL